jgi:hypothetical protein
MQTAAIKLTTTGNSRRLQSRSTASSGIDAPRAPARKTLLVWCSAAVGDSARATIVHALYYLPQNFVLMLPRAVGGAKLPDMMAHASIINQVRFYDPEGSSQDEPSFVADVIVRPGADGNLHVAARHTPGRRPTTKATPEAVASALLYILRA